MSQAYLQVSTQAPLAGLNLVFRANGALAALASMQSGTSQPTAFSTASTASLEGQLWLNTSITPHQLRRFDGAAYVPCLLNNPAPDALQLYSFFGAL